MDPVDATALSRRIDILEARFDGWQVRMVEMDERARASQASTSRAILMLDRDVIDVRRAHNADRADRAVADTAQNEDIAAVELGVAATRTTMQYGFGFIGTLLVVVIILLVVVALKV